MTTAGMDLAYWIVKAMAEVGYDPLEPAGSSVGKKPPIDSDPSDPVNNAINRIGTHAVMLCKNGDFGAIFVGPKDAENL